MDLFKYYIYLNEIEQTTKRSEVHKLISTFFNYSGNRYIKSLYCNSKLVCPFFADRSAEEQIESILVYSLLSKARQRYLSLGYSIHLLPNYAKRPLMSINVDETIKLIKDTECYTQQQK